MLLDKFIQEHVLFKSVCITVETLILSASSDLYELQCP